MVGGWRQGRIRKGPVFFTATILATITTSKRRPGRSACVYSRQQQIHQTKTIPMEKTKKPPKTQTTNNHPHLPKREKGVFFVVVF